MKTFSCIHIGGTNYNISLEIEGGKNKISSWVIAQEERFHNSPKSRAITAIL